MIVGASPLDLDAAALSPSANASTCNGDPAPKLHSAFNVAGIFICSQAPLPRREPVRPPELD